MDESRSEPRQRTLKGGHIVFNAGRSSIDCTVRNLSAHGAKLKVASIIGIPDAFELLFDDGRRFACAVAWRREGELGVTFA